MFNVNRSNVVNKAKEVGGKLVAGASLMAISGLSFAQGAGAEIIAEIDAAKALGLLVAGAGTVAILAVKYAKLPRAA